MPITINNQSISASGQLSHAPHWKWNKQYYACCYYWMECLIACWRDTQHKHPIYCRDSLKVEQTVLIYVAIKGARRYLKPFKCHHTWPHTAIVLLQRLLCILEISVFHCFAVICTKEHKPLLLKNHQAYVSKRWSEGYG